VATLLPYAGQVQGGVQRKIPRGAEGWGMTEGLHVALATADSTWPLLTQPGQLHGGGILQSWAGGGRGRNPTCCGSRPCCLNMIQ